MQTFRTRFTEVLFKKKIIFLVMYTLLFFIQPFRYRICGRWGQVKLIYLLTGSQDIHQGSILTVVHSPQASKNTNGPLKRLSGQSEWPVKIISENPQLVNRKNQSTRKMFPSFNFDKSDKICLCDLLNIGRSHGNFLFQERSQLYQCFLFQLQYVGLKLTLVRLDSWCVTQRSEVLGEKHLITC